MKQLVLRNLRVYFRDKLSVFFSLLSVLVTFLVYLLFLGDVWSGDLPDVPGARSMMSGWIMAGLLSIASVTTTLGAAGIMVDDRTTKVRKDFEASPLSRASLAGGYILSSFAIGSLMTTVGLILAEAYIVLNGGELLSLTQLLKMLGLVLLSVLSNTALLTFMVTFFKTNSSFGTASTLVGTLIGFLTGIYIPVGMLPQAVQGIVKLLPVSHTAVLMRQIFMEKPLQEVFSGAPQELVSETLQSLGVRFSLNGSEVPPIVSVFFIAGVGIVFFALSAWRMTKKEK